GSPEGASFLEPDLAHPGMPGTVDGAPLTAARAGQLAADALALANPVTAWQVALLLAIGPVVALWLLGPWARRLAMAATPALIVADLAMLWLTYHPYGRVADLRPVVPPPLTQPQAELYRVFTPPPPTDNPTQWDPTPPLT